MRGAPFKPDHPIGQRIATGLAKVGLALKARAWAKGTERRLTPTQGQILALLRLRGRPGSPLRDIADGLAVTAATASEAVAALAAKRLVVKRRVADDARSLEIRLTAAGRREALRAAAWPDILLEGIAALSAAEQSVFLRGVIKMIRALQERGEIPVSQMCVTCRFFRPRVHSDPRRPHHCDYVNASFGDAHLRLECPDHGSAEPTLAQRNWNVFVQSHDPP